MARKVSVTIVRNRARLTEVGERIAAGMGNVCQAVLDAADVPDDPPHGVGLVQTGAYCVYANGKKIAGTANKPRGVKAAQGIQAYVGYGFPGRFLEQGTVKMSARPFLVPAWLRVKDNITELVRSGSGGFK